MMSKLLTRREQMVLAAFAGAVLLGAAALFFHHRPGATPSPDPVPMSVESPHAPAPPAVSLAGLPPSPAPAVAVSPPPSPAVPSPPPEPPAPVSRRIRVAVSGAVHLPGAYGFDTGERVADALRRAGGARDDANLADINLAAPLIDGTTLPIPTQPVAGVRDGTLTIRRAAPASPVPAAYTLSGWRPPPPAAVATSPGAAEPGTDLADPNLPGEVMPGLDLNRATKEQLESLPGIGPVLAGRILEERARGPFKSMDDLQRVSGIGPKRLEALRPLAHATP